MSGNNKTGGENAPHVVGELDLRCRDAALIRASVWQPNMRSKSLAFRSLIGRSDCKLSPPVLHSSRTSPPCRFRLSHNGSHEAEGQGWCSQGIYDSFHCCQEIAMFTCRFPSTVHSERYGSSLMAHGLRRPLNGYVKAYSLASLAIENARTRAPQFQRPSITPRTSRILHMNQC